MGDFDFQIAMALEQQECIDKALALIKERQLYCWNFGEFVRALCDMYFQNAEGEDVIRELMDKYNVWRKIERSKP